MEDPKVVRKTPARKKRASPNARQVGGTHYKELGIQPWDYILQNNLGYMEGNVVKYVTRHATKGKKEDLEKALHYLQKLILHKYGEL